jgi:DNA-binding transcriptional LysR family regulator
MDIRFIDSLISVIETGSIAAAARKQNLTAAAISQRIKSLEQTLNCTLLSRTGHSAKATDACLNILPRLRDIQRQVDLIQHDLDTKKLSGELRVGVISSLLSSVLPRCITRLKQQAPDILLQITPGPSQFIYQQLIEQKIDVALLVEPHFALPKVLQQTLLFVEPLALIASSSKAITTTTAHALCAQPYIQYDHLSWGGALAKRYLTDQQIQVDILCEIDALESIALMVEQGMGVSLIPAWEGLHKLSPLINIKEIDNPIYDRRITLLSHRQNAKEKIMQAFDQALSAVLPQ